MALTRRERRKRNRQKWRASRKTSKRRSTKSRSRAAPDISPAALRRARTRAGRVLTLNQVMKQLRGSKKKAWICAGLVRTGCGGGRKRYGGSRQIGVLRP
jgi:hypothetical protein